MLWSLVPWSLVPWSLVLQPEPGAEGSGSVITVGFLPELYQWTTGEGTARCRLLAYRAAPV